MCVRKLISFFGKIKKTTTFCFILCLVWIGFLSLAQLILYWAWVYRARLAPEPETNKVRKMAFYPHSQSHMNRCLSLSRTERGRR